MGLGHVKDILEADIEWASPSQKLVAVVMSYAADRKGICRLTQSELAAQTALSLRRVSDLIDGLCELAVMVRLGHGRYGIRFGLPENLQQPFPHPKGAQEEMERLLAIRRPEQSLVFNGDTGWPTLQDE